MQKKLISLALASAFTIPSVVYAQGAGVKIGGHVQTEYSSIKIDQTPGQGGSTAAQNYRQESIADNGFFSRWNITVTEDLGNGLQANAFIDFGLNIGAGVTEIPREQWVGLSSKSWGEIQFGSLHSPFKTFAGGPTLDPFVATNLQLRGSGGAQYSPNNGFGAAGFVDHAIKYISPVFSGVRVAVLLAPGDATQTDPLTTPAGRNGNVNGRGSGLNGQIVAKYTFGAHEVFAGYSRDSANDAQKAAAAVNAKRADDETVWRIGAKLQFGDIGVNGQYDSISDALAFNSGGATCGGGGAANGVGDAGVTTAQCNSALNTNGDGDIWNLGVNYKLGKTLFVVQGGKTTADAEGAANKRTAKNITLGVIYNFSKRTRVYGGYQKVEVDGAHVVSQAGAGATDSTGTVLLNQPDRSVWLVGMRHSF